MALPRIVALHWPVGACVRIGPCFFWEYFLGGAHVSDLQQQYFEDRRDEEEEVEAIGGHGSEASD